MYDHFKKKNQEWLKKLRGMKGPSSAAEGVRSQLKKTSCGAAIVLVFLIINVGLITKITEIIICNCLGQSLKTMSNCYHPPPSASEDPFNVWRPFPGSLGSQVIFCNGYVIMGR